VGRDGKADIIRRRGVAEVKARRWLLLALGLLLAAGLARLGLWQSHRAVEKQAMLARVQAVLAERRPIALADAGKDSGYAWTAGRGRFLPGPLLLLDNQRRGAAVGVQVLAPFQPRRGGPLLVELGWLPVSPDRRMPEPALPAGELDVAGLLLPPPAAGLALGADHVVQGRHWLLTRVDVPALARATGLPLAPRVLRLDPALRVGFARDLDILPNSLPPERHRGYALQWYGLSATLAALSLFLFLRPRP
jgi:surfeit locus 1 family protein